MPYTTVVSGTTITASWGNANVRDQVVTPFASASARSSAITSPVDGMLSARTDSKVWEGYSATAAGWVPVQQMRVGSTSHTSAVTATTIEVVVVSITFTAVAGRRYRMRYEGCYQSTVAADLLVWQMRYKAGASVDASGPSFGVKACHAPTVSQNIPFAMEGEVTGIGAGQATAGITLIRNSGTGTVKADASAGLQEGRLFLDDMGV